MIKQIVVSTVLSAALASAAVAASSEQGDDLVKAQLVAKVLNPTSQSDCDVSKDAVLENIIDIDNRPWKSIDLYIETNTDPELVTQALRKSRYIAEVQRSTGMPDPELPIKFRVSKMSVNEANTSLSDVTKDMIEKDKKSRKDWVRVVKVDGNTQLNTNKHVRDALSNSAFQAITICN